MPAFSGFSKDENGVTKNAGIQLQRSEFDPVCVKTTQSDRLSKLRLFQHVGECTKTGGVCSILRSSCGTFKP
jgi:hypothetical protein